MARHHAFLAFLAKANTSGLLPLRGKAEVVRDTEKVQNWNNIFFIIFFLFFPQILMVTIRNTERICKRYADLPMATE